MYETILLPTDGSEHAVRAAEHARTLAEAFDATVHVLGVVDVQAAAGLFDAGGVDDEFVGRLDARGQDAVDAAAGVVDGDDRAVTTLVHGDPRKEILAYAEEVGADVLAMGTHGRTGVRRYVAGSVTEHVVRKSPVPVLTVRATERSDLAGPYEEVLVPTDGSDAATAAVEHALAVAERMDARVHALNVMNVATLAGSPDYTMPAEFSERLREAGEAATEAVAERARDRGLEALTAVRQGYPASDILDYADEHGVDLVAMGTAGRTGLNRFLLGSTTERVIRHADVPVLAVNARDRAAE